MSKESPTLSKWILYGYFIDKKRLDSNLSKTLENRYVSLTLKEDRHDLDSLACYLLKES
jgi:hypothetical protein